MWHGSVKPIDTIAEKTDRLSFFLKLIISFLPELQSRMFWSQYTRSFSSTNTVPCCFRGLWQYSLKWHRERLAGNQIISNYNLQISHRVAPQTRDSVLLLVQCTFTCTVYFYLYRVLLHSHRWYVCVGKRAVCHSDSDEEIDQLLAGLKRKRRESRPSLCKASTSAQVVEQIVTTDPPPSALWVQSLFVYWQGDDDGWELCQSVRCLGLGLVF